MQFEFPNLDPRTAALIADLRAESDQWLGVAATKVRRIEGRIEVTPVARFCLGIGHDFAALADDLEIEATGGLQ
jgi:hypothetical protein